MAVADTRIWATRPEHQNGQWCQTLAELGYPVVDLPLMLIEPVTDPAEIQAVKNLILDFDQFHKVIFVSQNAVRETFAWLRDYWPQLPVDIEYIAVGSRTAEALVEQGVTPIEGTQTMDSDELLALPHLQNVWGQKILICRGRGGLPRLGETLHERGAIVRYCELYHRRLPPVASAAAAPFLAAGCAEDVIAVFSGETLQNLVRVLDANGSAERAMRLVVPGKRVTQEAEKLGFSRVTTALNATSACMLAAIREALAAAA
jgi:uroporphyrinogen-III synthase